jgi:short-subunit dehydrogenase
MAEITIITGGSSGLGLEIARQLASQKKNLALIARDKDKLMLVQKELQEHPVHRDILIFNGDISTQEFVTSVFSELGKSYSIEAVYNCAGVGVFCAPEENTEEGIKRAFDASLTGLILVSSAAIAAMKDCGGTIINTLSTAALKGNPGESVYCAAKWGARGFTEAIKAYTKGSAIRVIAVYPGGMNTPFWSPDCGMQPNVEAFMDVKEVANQIVCAAEDKKSLYVSDITINRR